MIPPHLPPPTCDLKQHRQWQRITILLFATVFGLVAGLSGAAMMIGWIWPGFGGGADFTQTRYSLPNYRTQLESRARQEITDRVVAIYSGAQVSQKVAYLPQRNFLGNGVMVSSDGWLVIYPVDYSGNYRNWQAVLSDGSVYKVATVLPDKISGLVFARLDLSESAELGRGGLQFKVANFVDGLEVGTDLFVFNGFSWQNGTVVEKTINSFGNSHLDSAPLQRLVFASEFSPGGVVINSQGRVAGLTLGGREFLPFQYITRLLPAVLNGQRIIYSSLGVEGWYSVEQPIVATAERITGFFVSKGAGQLHAGDIILEMNGQILNDDDLWLNLKIGESVRLKVWRFGKLLDMKGEIVEK